jgi:hypothetical protein
MYVISRTQICDGVTLKYYCVAEIRNRRLHFEAVQHLVQLLPVPNRDTLWALLNFLVTVSRNAGDYKDESGNDK